MIPYNAHNCTYSRLMYQWEPLRCNNRPYQFAARGKRNHALNTQSPLSLKVKSYLAVVAVLITYDFTCSL